MARATTRASQRQATQPGGSQPRASQSQRRRRDEEEEEIDMDAAEDGEDPEMGEEDIEIDRKASDLVRLALFTEHRRVPLKRDEISKKVMGSKPRQFTRVLARAQDMLRGTFGMELVEMVARVDLEPAAKDDSASQKKKATPAGTRSYILRSTLDPTLISKACAQNTALLQVEQSERVLLQDVEDENTIGTRSVGSILAWQYADQLGSIGILHVILALILVNGRAISDSDLWTLLKRLRLQPNSTIPLSSQTTHQSVTTEAFLTQLIRQGYLDHRRIGEQKGGAGKKRGRIVAATQATNGEEENNYEWRWGPRAMSEVGEVGISRFVAEFIVNQKRHRNEEDEYEEESEMDASAKKQFEKLIQGVEKAAGGGQLVDITGK